MKLNRPKAAARLLTMRWEDLDWLEQECRRVKSSADKPRVYRSDGDRQHRAEARQSMLAEYVGGIEKHHGGDT